MAINTSGTSPDQRRKCDEAFKAEALRLAGESRSTQAAARQLGIRPKLLHRWQQARLVAGAGSAEAARDPEVRALRAANKRLAQELDMLKKPWSSSAGRPGERLSAHRPAGRPCASAARCCAWPRPRTTPGRQRRRQMPAAEPA